MTIEEMKGRKKELGYSNKTIAKKAGLPLSTVEKIFSGATSSPRETTIRALEGVLGPDHNFRYDLTPPAHQNSFVCEPQSPYAVKKTVGEETQDNNSENKLYTLEDYLSLPDDQRVELIDGIFYDMAAPTTQHQAIAGFIHKQFLDHVLNHKGPCFPFISPVDVLLDCDDKTVVQPDVLIVCDQDKYQKGRVFGAPDLVIEVLSPSTKKKDMQLKLFKYGNAGVREYWMIDPKKKLVIQYDLENLEAPVIYGFEDQVPVLIWEGKCRVDFKVMMESIGFIFEAGR